MTRTTETLTQRLVRVNAEAHRAERVRSLRETGKSASDDAQATAGAAAMLRVLAEFASSVPAGSPHYGEFDFAGLADEVEVAITGKAS